MNSLLRSRYEQIFRAAAPVGLVLLVAAILLVFPPAQYSFYPRCPFHHFFGILCPGCGATRALAALLHGNFHEAFRLNAFFILLLPFLGGYAIRYYVKFVAHKPIQWPQPRPAAIYITLAAAIIFTVARNV
jgi:hypothetical protein